MSLNKINIDWVLKWLMKIIISKDFSLQANAFNGFLTLQIDLLIICLNIYANVMTDDIPQKVNWQAHQCSSRTNTREYFVIKKMISFSHCVWYTTFLTMIIIYLLQFKYHITTVYSEKPISIVTFCSIVHL